MTPTARLLCAAAHGDRAGVQAMLQHGVPVDVRDGKGRTPLMLAVQSGSVPTAQLLYAAGADCMVVNNGHRPLIDYAESAEMARWVLSVTPPPHQEQVATRLLFRCCAPVERLQTALDFGARVNARDKRGSTPLHYHAICGRPHCVRLLLAAGAHPDVRNCHGCTPLYMATFFTNAEVMRLLIAAGADVHTTNQEGRSLRDLLYPQYDSHRACLRVLEEMAPLQK